MTKLEKSGAKKTKTAKPKMPKCIFVKASELDESSANQNVKASELGESSTNQNKRKREADNPQDRPFYQFF
ncbi:unnamed protein product [Trifolium pratense]|uniref:Uncharacterized protein n=1 Tax=Trifolium pratense TaxID=57577 RepID=A0ACB0L5M8_TRIPR|nr:unnamed protein product [Trifolium pratense]